MSRRIPERLTLVEMGEDGLAKTIVIDDENRNLVISMTGPDSNKAKASIWLTETQAKKLRARIDKFLRENR